MRARRWTGAPTGEVVYSCTGRAANKTPEDGIEHMAAELERRLLLMA